MEVAVAVKKQLRKILTNKQNLVAIGVLLLSSLVYVWISTQVDANLLTPEGLQKIVTNAGIWGILTYIAIIALAVVGRSSCWHIQRHWRFHRQLNCLFYRKISRTLNSKDVDRKDCLFFKRER